MPRIFVTALLGLAVASLATGCGESDGVTLAPAGGTVTFQGAPLAGANVTFVPAEGPVAMGATDDAGKFSLSTGGRAGAPLGDCKVSVSLIAPTDDLSNLSDEERTMELTKMMGKAQGKFGEKENKSLVPKKYADADTSGLQFTVSSDSDQNDFKIELTP